jgi:hypothetical protein
MHMTEPKINSVMKDPLRGIASDMLSPVVHSPGANLGQSSCKSSDCSGPKTEMENTIKHSYIRLAVL